VIGVNFYAVYFSSFFLLRLLGALSNLYTLHWNHCLNPVYLGVKTVWHSQLQETHPDNFC